ncbi:MAG: DsbE family thiol:disulfide interchange protein [Candidatus Berkiellales bacterium]
MNLLFLRQQRSRFIPVILFAIILWMLYQGLAEKHPRMDKAKGKPFPEFTLFEIRKNQWVNLQDIKGKPQIIHVWASWCGVCLKEHQEWIAIKEKWHFPIVGVIYRDDPNQVLHFLNKKDDPYDYLLNDASGKLGLDLGLTGTPETYILDANGVIQYHHLGALDVRTFENQLLPYLQQKLVEQGDRK